MAGAWAIESFPQFEEALRRLTNEHLELKDEPLHLALAYSSPRDSQDIFLLEVIGFRVESDESEGNFFEVSYANTADFSMEPEQKLHLILTDPKELKTALRDAWPTMVEIVGAISRDDFKVLFEDEVGQQLLTEIQTGFLKQEPVRG